MDPFKSDNQTETLPNPDNVTLEDLVGEGKKYSDVNALVKSRVHADIMIAQLKKEAEEAREEALTRISVDEAIKKLQNDSLINNGKVDETPEPAKEDDGAKPLTIEDVEKLLQTKTKTERMNANLTLVVTELDKIAGGGDKTRDFIKAKAEELNMTPDRLKELGSENPDVLFKILGVTKSTPTAPNPTSYKAPTDAKVDPNNPVTADDFRELRRTNPAKYFSASTQKALLKLRMDELRSKS